MTRQMRSMLLALMVSLWSAEAAIVVTPVITGGFSYDYTVDNSGPLGIILFQLTLPIDPTSVTAPADWMSNTFALGTDTIVQWASEISEISAGGSLSGFVVTSTFGPVSMAYEVIDSEFNVLSGTTLGPGASPSSVPELGTFAFAASSIGMFPIIQRWRIRKT